MKFAAADVVFQRVVGSGRATKDADITPRGVDGSHAPGSNPAVFPAANDSRMDAGLGKLSNNATDSKQAVGVRRGGRRLPSAQSGPGPSSRLLSVRAVGLQYRLVEFALNSVQSTLGLVLTPLVLGNKLDEHSRWANVPHLALVVGSFNADVE